MYSLETTLSSLVTRLLNDDAFDGEKVLPTSPIVESKVSALVNLSTMVFDFAEQQEISLSEALEVDWSNFSKQAQQHYTMMMEEKALN